MDCNFTQYSKKTYEYSLCCNINLTALSAQCKLLSAALSEPDVCDTSPYTEQAIKQHECTQCISHAFGQFHGTECLQIKQQKADNQIENTHTYVHGSPECRICGTALVALFEVHILFLLIEVQN
jgi:hypothetical protein